jgi:ribosomal protein L27
VVKGIDGADTDDGSRRLGCRAHREVALETPITLRERGGRCAHGELSGMGKSRGVRVEQDSRCELRNWPLERSWYREHARRPEEGSSRRGRSSRHG